MDLLCFFILSCICYAFARVCSYVPCVYHKVLLLLKMLSKIYFGPGMLKYGGFRLL